MEIIGVDVAAIAAVPAGSCVHIHGHALPGFGKRTKHDRSERRHPGRDVEASWCSAIRRTGLVVVPPAATVIVIVVIIIIPAFPIREAAVAVEPFNYARERAVVFGAGDDPVIVGIEHLEGAHGERMHGLVPESGELLEVQVAVGIGIVHGVSVVQQLVDPGLSQRTVAVSIDGVEDLQAGHLELPLVEEVQAATVVVAAKLALAYAVPPMAAARAIAVSVVVVFVFIGCLLSRPSIDCRWMRGLWTRTWQPGLSRAWRRIYKFVSLELLPGFPGNAARATRPGMAFSHGLYIALAQERTNPTGCLHDVPL
ncbi:MAG: hypothetical protein OXT64_01205 [Gammaproteobacteria bacterium]|nr:hypothetical protein [Gammaproteobacteria bacterium]